MTKKRNGHPIAPPEPKFKASKFWVAKHGETVVIIPGFELQAFKARQAAAVEFRRLTGEYVSDMAIGMEWNP